jgi:hypothetical protein
LLKELGVADTSPELLEPTRDGLMNLLEIYNIDARHVATLAGAPDNADSIGVLPFDRLKGAVILALNEQIVAYVVDHTRRRLEE